MRFLMALTVWALLASCGQKGPLYLRDNPPPGVRPAKPKPYEPLPYPREPAQEQNDNAK
jgi:predicted small lipoprotein YifL